MADVNRFVTENSYGQTTLAVTITPVLTLPKPTARYRDTADYGDLLEDARQAAANAGFHLDAYDVHCLYTRPLLANTDGRATVGGTGILLQTRDAGLVCHELGHAFGLWHANAWYTTDGTATGAGFNGEYGDLFSTMGSGGGELWHFNACEKFGLGWLPPTHVQPISTNGIYRLAPADSPQLVDGQTYALTLKKDLVRDYWMETRRQFSRHPALVNALLLTWSPWGGSGYGTQLLDTHPETRTFTDAPLLPGEAFFDPDLGVKVMTAPADGPPEGSLDVLVQRVNQLLIEAESAEAVSPAALNSDLEASAGLCLGPGGLAESHLTFKIEVPEPGYYVAWIRYAWPAHGSAVISLSVHGELVALADLEPVLDARAWRWARLASSAALKPSLGRAVPIFLPAGSQTLDLVLNGTAPSLDCLLLTTDPTGNPAPVISSFPDQRLVAGKGGGSIPFTVLDVQTPSSDLLVEARSSNTNLFPAASIHLQGGGVQRRLTFTPVPGQIGTATISVTVKDPNGNQGRASFRVDVIGLIQAQVDSARAGDRVVIPNGAYPDHVVINKSLVLEAETPGGVVLDGAGTGVPLTVSSEVEASVRGLTVRNGLGNGVVNLGALSLNECSIINDQRFNGPDTSGLLNLGVLQMNHTLVSGATLPTGSGINNHGLLLVRDCTIRDNATRQRGGGLVNQASARAVIHASTLSGNRVVDGHGGAIYNAGDLALINVTLSGNVASQADSENDAGLGGGLLNLGSAFVHSCTVAFNRAAIQGGGIHNRGTLALGNSIVAANSLTGGIPSDLSGTIVSHGFNLIQARDGFTLSGVTAGNLLGVNPLLAPLADNGGPTWTHGLDANSPAVDAGSSAGLSVDQRGFLRRLDVPDVPNRDDACDIGAFELTTDSSNSPIGPEFAQSDGDPKPRLFIERAGSGFPTRMTLTSPQESARYAVQASTDQTTWLTISTNVAKGFLIEWDADPESCPYRFYRVQVLP